MKQDGEKLTGVYSSAQLGEAKIAGSVNGQEINFVVGGPSMSVAC